MYPNYFRLTRRMWRTTVVMIIAEDWTKGSCAGDSSLGVRVADTKSCDGGFSMKDLEGVVQNESCAYSGGTGIG